MVEPVEETVSAIQLQPLPDYAFADPFIFSAGIITLILATIVAFSFYRFYRLTGFIYLLGLAIGFSFIAFAEVLLAIDVWLEIYPELFNMLFWIRLLSLSYGFSLMAVSYYYKRREDDRTFVVRATALSAIPVMIMIAVMVFAPPVFEFPPYNQVDEYFRAFNLIMLAYVFRSALTSMVEQGRKEFMYIPAAFAILWLGQFSALIFAIDGSHAASVAQHTAKIIGYALFVAVVSQILRGKKLPKAGMET